jgi:hypothetical protein
LLTGESSASADKQQKTNGSLSNRRVIRRGRSQSEPGPTSYEVTYNPVFKDRGKKTTPVGADFSLPSDTALGAFVEGRDTLVKPKQFVKRLFSPFVNGGLGRSRSPLPTGRRNLVEF